MPTTDQAPAGLPQAETEPPTSSGGPRQLRLALSMNGGVSLAVWIGGAVGEIDEVRAGTGWWGDLLAATGHDRRAMVDVMAGASAGGLNAVLLAQSLRSGTSFAQFLPLWQQHADIDRLVQPPATTDDAQRRGVLDGRHFMDRLRDALAASDGDVLDHDLAVLASATLVVGRPVAYTDVPGATIDETRSDAYFHVARRGGHDRGLDGFHTTPPLLSNVTALATIGRATSSLPGLFEPVPITRSTFGSRLVGAFGSRHVDDDDPVQIMDGGVIDNVPIARAIRAIAASAADHRVHRVLLYLHPDPSSAPEAEPPDTAIGVVKAFRSKGSESIREDIELLRSHNDAVDRRAGAATALLVGLLDGARRDDKPAGDRHGGGDSSTLASIAAKAMLVRTATDPASELPWHAPDIGRLVPIVDGPGNVSRRDLEDQLEPVVRDPSILVAATLRRTIHGLQRLIRTVEGTNGAPRFDAVKAPLYEVLLLADLVHSYQLARFVGHGPGADAVRRLVASRAELASIRVPVTGPDTLTWHALASWDTDEFRAHGDITLLDHLDQQLAAIVDDLPSSELLPDGPEARPDVAVAVAVLRGIDHGTITVADVERTLLPLAAELVASDQRIAFVRATGAADTPASRAFVEISGTTQPKVAGVQLHHLGAFFDVEWRTNDWWWGRLDTVSTLLDAVLDAEALGQLRTSGWLEQQGIEPDAGAEAIAAALVARRQLELLNERSGRSDPSLAEATSSENPDFAGWAGQNRRFSGLIGTRRLTSTAIRGVLTAWRTTVGPMSTARRVLLAPVRSALLATVGVLLAGRRAAATLAWTLCVLAAVRASSPTGRWVTWAVGVALVAAIVWIVERKVRPTGTGVTMWLPYVVTGVGVVGGVAAIVRRDDLVDRWTWWALPVLGAVVSAWMLFFWMSRWARVAFCVLTAALYGAWAYNAYDFSAGRASTALDWWPLRAMWVCWSVAVLGMPMLIARLPDRWLRPDRP